MVRTDRIIKCICVNRVKKRENNNYLEWEKSNE